MFSLPLLKRHDSTSLSLLTSLRHMGGGPRTFPGGLNKWQWKRLHEKKAKEKEKRLLDHEKQLYQARIRSSIRAEFSRTDPPPVGPTHGPRSADDHIKGLADRFMKEGAEDLWNERDGPIKSGPLIAHRQIRAPIDVRKLVSGENSNGIFNNGIEASRDYSVCSVNSNDGSKLKSRSFFDKSVSSMNSSDGIKPRHYSVCSMDLNDGSKLKSHSFFHKSVSSMNSSDGIKPRHYSVCSMDLNDGSKLKSYSFFNTSVDSMNFCDGIKPRHYSVCSMDLNDGSKLKSHSFFNKLVFGENASANSGYLSNGFNKPRDYSAFSMNLNDGSKYSFSNKKANLMNFSDGIKPRYYSVCSMDLNDGSKLKSQDFHARSVSSVNSSYGSKLKSYSFQGSSVNSMKLSDGFKPRLHCVYGGSGNLNVGVKPRNYSAYLKNLNGGMKTRHFSAQAKGRTRSRFNFSDESSDEDSASEGEKEEREKKGSERRFTSSAALGKYDTKKTRRVPLKFLDAEEDLSKQIETIRNEVKQRSMVRNVVDNSDEDSILSQKRFDECNVSPLTVKALTQAGYVQMTRVQEATLSVCLEGNDALVKAKTGTGKSAAFLLPAIETVLKALNSKKKERAPPVYVLILCPMRELASQIAAEANVMLKYHEGIGVQTLVGGTRFKVDQKQLESDPCQIIVATPGRLLDHIESKSGISVRLLGLKMLILDEADHLLDLGFRKDIEKIVDCLPRERQSLLFSATVPKEVRRISQLVLKREQACIDTVGMGCVETPSTVKQFKIVAPHDQHFQMVHHLLNEHISQTPDYKVIVFCTTAMVTSLMFLLLREFKMNVREIHSRKPQLYRTRVSEEFKESKRQILISSDVSARGMNYPGVTLVIQVGIPSDREHYIHRLGRTGREGKEGEGILLLAPWEEYFLDDIKDLPIANFPVPHLDPDLKTKIEQSMAKIDSSVREAAYHAWLGYYNSIAEISRDKTTLAELANQFSQSIGLEKPPSLFRKTALKMGLRDIPGIRIRK